MNDTNADARIQKLVDMFARAVIEQTEAMKRIDTRTGNRWARRGHRTFEELRQFGDRGRESLTQLFSHERADVRVMAACYLLRYRTKESLRVLRTESRGQGSIAFGASEALLRWNEGAWSLDPE